MVYGHTCIYIEQDVHCSYIERSMELMNVAVLVLVLSVSCTAQSEGDFYSLAAKDIQGNDISLDQYRGKVRSYIHDIKICVNNLYD